MAYPREHIDLIRDAYVALCQEPWCFTPEEIDRLTDWQITNLYLLPAQKRAEEFARQHPAPGLPQPSTNGYHHGSNGKVEDKAPDYEPGTPQHREQIEVLAFQGQMGMTPAQARALYDRQLRQYYAQRGEEPPPGAFPDQPG